MADFITKKRPIDAFKEYFLEVKPYHSKILEIVEKYNFHDDVVVNIDDSLNVEWDWANTPLCKPVGFGLEWDEECGFDPLECCQLGTCPPTVENFDKLTPVTSHEILEVDAEQGRIVLSGHLNYDTMFPIKRKLSNTNNKFSVSGDISAYMQSTFAIVPYATLSYMSNTHHNIMISDNHAINISNQKTFRIQGSDTNDGIYHVKSSSYTQQTNTTTVKVYEPLNIAPVTGNILVRSSGTNNGVYTLSDYTSNNSETIITVAGTRKLGADIHKSSILFKNGYISGRAIRISNNSSNNNGDYIILESNYDNSTNTTEIILTGNLTDNANGGTVSLLIDLDKDRFLKDLSCSPPKETNVSINFSEVLVIGTYDPASFQ